MAEAHPIPANPQFKNRTGHRFGRLLVVAYAGHRNRVAHWSCRCDCGGEVVVAGNSLLRGATQSCGCLSSEVTAAKNRANATHRLSHTTTHRVWAGIRARCRNPKSKDFARYGGRGIKVCERWNSFDNFLADMGICPPGHSIDRIDPNGDYCPGNCRWATHKVQQRNRREHRMLTYDGRTQCLSAWAEEMGIDTGTLHRRLGRYGWSVERALSTPVRHFRLLR